jgi:hypothetical protein
MYELELPKGSEVIFGEGTVNGAYFPQSVIVPALEKEDGCLGPLSLILEGEVIGEADVLCISTKQVDHLSDADLENNVHPDMRSFRNANERLASMGVGLMDKVTIVTFRTPCQTAYWS